MMPVRFASDTPALPSIAEELTDDPSPPIRARTGPDVAAHLRPNSGGERSELARIRADVPPDRHALEKITADTAIMLD
jgi:hypothetical protein